MNKANKNNVCCKCGKGFVKKSNNQKRCYSCREVVKKETNKRNSKNRYIVTKKEKRVLDEVEPEATTYIIKKLRGQHGASWLYEG